MTLQLCTSSIFCPSTTDVTSQGLLAVLKVTLKTSQIPSFLLRQRPTLHHLTLRNTHALVAVIPLQHCILRVHLRVWMPDLRHRTQLAPHRRAHRAAPNPSPQLRAPREAVAAAAAAPARDV